MRLHTYITLPYHNMIQLLTSELLEEYFCIPYKSVNTRQHSAMSTSCLGDLRFSVFLNLTPHMTHLIIHNRLIIEYSIHTHTKTHSIKNKQNHAYTYTCHGTQANSSSLALEISPNTPPHIAFFFVGLARPGSSFDGMRPFP